MTHYHSSVESLWLNVPLDEYEAHMRAPAVAQLHSLAEIFSQALALCRPQSVAILGVAGGNGLDRIDPTVTHRVIGVDVNPEYLDAVPQRVPHLPGLELIRQDLRQSKCALPPVDLVHAALLFEHTGWAEPLDNAIAMVTPGGTLSVVLQLPSPTADGVASSAPPSIQTLKQAFQFVPPLEFEDCLTSRGFARSHQQTIPVASGKSFWWALFARTKAGTLGALSPP